ncbi:MAG: DinB family protein [Bacteroidota bacterium]
MSETPEQYTARILSYQQGKKPMAILSATAGKIVKLLMKSRPASLKKRSGPDKWSAGEILAHLADSELVFSFRLRLILGSNGTPIQAFDQDVWAKYSQYAKLEPLESFEQFRVLREANVRLLKMIPKGMWDYYGMHSERGKENVVRMTEMFAGHDINHVRQLEGMLRRK